MLSEVVLSKVYNSEAKRARPSIDSLSDLNRIISADGSPITLIPFVARPQIEEKICEVIGLNLFNMFYEPSHRTQDYLGIVISGGSGTGKTRIGFEINNIVEHNKLAKGLKDELNATFEHIYINMDEIKNLLGPGLDDDANNKYPRIPEHIDEAYKMLTVLIATYFFAKAWSRKKIQNAMELMDSTKGYDYDEVVELIRKEKKLDEPITLIIVLQIDEFQTGNYWTVTLLRIIRSILVQVTHRTLIIPVCTGTAPSKIANLGEYTFSITQYAMANINLSPMNFEDSMSLFKEFTINYYGDSDILPTDDEIFYRCAVNSVRGIPVIIEIAVRTLLHLKNEGVSAFQNYDTAKKYWENLKFRVNQKYSKKHWLSSLHNENNIMKLLFYIHVQKHVTKKDQLSGCTIEEVEASGLIYLDETIKDVEFIPRAPLILIVALVEFFDLHIFFDPILLNPFTLINQDNFPDFILRIHHATYGLMIRTGIRYITLSEIYGRYIDGPRRVLDHRIYVEIIDYHEQPPLIPKDSSKEKFTRPDLDRKRVAVMCSEDIDKRGYQEIDATLGKYIIKLRRRISSADAILPHADEQYKYSEALESGYLVHKDKTGELSIDTVGKEVKKANATGAERLVIVTPKRFEGNIPENCAIVAGADFVNFIIIYADLVARISTEIIDD
ncbi:15931_t:CDS:2 [Funneliformis geosporum]|nr:15931_t:CDS:2 [Funneliformis geosporum]